MKYVIHLLGQSLLILFLGNLCIAFVPRNIRHAFKTTFKIVNKLLKASIIQIKKLVKEVYGFHKKKEVKSKQPSNVINLKDKAKAE